MLNCKLPSRCRSFDEGVMGDSFYIFIYFPQIFLIHKKEKNYSQKYAMIKNKNLSLREIKRKSHVISFPYLHEIEAFESLSLLWNSICKIQTCSNVHLVFEFNYVTRKCSLHMISLSFPDVTK